MSRRTTTIEWTHHTLNFWWGCTKVSPACTHCYAEGMAKRLGNKLFGHPVLWGPGKQRGQRLEAARHEAHTLNAAAQRTGQRYRVFVNSMSDIWDDQVPIEWLVAPMETIVLCPNLDLQLLTKRPENALKRIAEVMAWLDKDVLVPSKEQQAEMMSDAQVMHWQDFKQKWARYHRCKTSLMLGRWLGGTPPPNVWIGATMENQEWAAKRLPHLIKIPAVVRFISAEPLVGPIDFSVLPEYFAMRSPSGTYPFSGVDKEHRTSALAGGIHWVITGGESGAKASPSHPDWFRSLRDQCTANGVAFFFKQWGEWGTMTLENLLGRQLGKLKQRCLWPNGTHQTPTEFVNYALSKGGRDEAWNVYGMGRLGKKSTGNLLDGVLHQQFPQP